MILFAKVIFKHEGHKQTLVQVDGWMVDDPSSWWTKQAFAVLLRIWFVKQDTSYSITCRGLYMKNKCKHKQIECLGGCKVETLYTALKCQISVQVKIVIKLYIVFWPRAISKSHSMDSTKKHNFTTTNWSITSNTMDTKDSLGRRKNHVIKPNWPKNKVNKRKTKYKTSQNQQKNPKEILHGHPSWSPALAPPGKRLPCLAHHWRVRYVPRSTAPQVIVQSSHFLDESFKEEISSSQGLRGLLNWGKNVGIY